jgi:hypothetical protein
MSYPLDQKLEFWPIGFGLLSIAIAWVNFEVFPCRCCMSAGMRTDWLISDQPM